MRRPISHTLRDGWASLSHRANDRRMCYQFLIFDLGGLPLGQRSPKVETTYYPPRSTILQNFSPIARMVYEICITKFFHFLAPGGYPLGPKFTKRGEDLGDYEIYHRANCKISSLYANPRRRYPLPKFSGQKTKKQTVTGISPTCLSACGDN